MNRLLARVYPSALRGFGATLELSRVGFEGFWLGVLDVDGLAAVDEWYYDHATSYAAAEHNRGGLFKWERQLLDDHFVPGGRVLVSAVGGGREIFGLLERGYDAHGFECNRTLYEAARGALDAAGHPGRVEWTPRGSWPVVATRFDGLVLGWGSYTLGATSALRIEMLRQAADRVVDGGPIVLSFLAVERFGRAHRFVAAIANALRRLRRAAPPELGDRMAPNFVHVFTRDQVEREVAAAGLQLLSYSNDSYGHAVVSTPVHG